MRISCDSKSAINPTLAQFLMTLKPEMVEKAGLSDMMFGDDPRGFIGGLLYEEGATWQRSRKIITEEFNQEKVFFSVKLLAFVVLETNHKSHLWIHM